MSKFFSGIAGKCKQSRHSVLYRIWFFTSIFVICAIIISLINNYTIKSITINEISDSNKNFVNYIVDTMDNQINEITKLAITLGKDSDVLQFSHSYDLTNYDAITFKKIVDKFIISKVTKSIIDDIFICNEDLNKVLSTHGTYDADFFLDKYIVKLEDQIPQLHSMEGKLIILPKNHIKKMERYYSYKEFGVISYIYSINPDTFMYIIVNESQIRESLYDASYEKDNIIVILDKEGNLISSNIDISDTGITPENLLKSSRNSTGSYNDIVKLQDGKYIMNSKKSGINEFMYFVVFPVDIINAKADMINRSTYLLILALLILGIIMTAILRKTIYLPIRGIINLLNVNNTDSKRGKNEFEAIKHGIASISKENERFITTLQKQQPFVEEILLNRLICGMAYDNSESLVNDLNIKYSDFVVLSVIYAESDTVDQKSLRDKLENYLEEEFSIRKLYFNSDENLYIVCINKCEDFVGKIRIFIYNSNFGPASVMIGISQVHQNILDIRRACKESIEALEFRTTVDIHKKVFTYGSNNIDNYKTARISLDEEISLINNVFNGNTNNVEECILKFDTRNRNLPFKYQKYAYIYLVNLLLIAISNKSIRYDDIFDVAEKDLAAQFEECQNISQIQKKIKQVYKNATNYCGSKIREDDAKLLNYVNENYHKGICLEQLAEHMSMSASYLSSYFKQVTGVNFLAYVNNLKLQKAKELLESTDKTIAEIAEYLGFADSNTFIRLFKKKEGITPGLFKKIR